MESKIKNSVPVISFIKQV